MHDDDRDVRSVLARDLKIFVDRRQVLRWIAASSLLPLAGCPANDNGGTSEAGSDGGATPANANATTLDAATCQAVPEETGGPYPGDGSNGPNALALSGIVRSDITASIGDASGVAAGVPLTIKLKLLDANGCVPLAGHAVYLWHCTQDGDYSLYTGAAAGENYLRGVQEAGDDGGVAFQSIFPGCYSGRWPHIHYEVYESLEAATSGSGKVATSQIALPEATCSEVYAADGYAASVQNLAQTSLATDNVFSDGATLELPEVSGSLADGYTITLNVAVAV